MEYTYIHNHQSQFIEMFGDMKYLTSDKTMSDFFDMKAGQSITAENIIATYDLELFPCYGGNGLRGYVTHYTHEGHYCLIGRQGALCGNVNLTDGKFFATEHAIVVTPKISINTYWLFFALSEMNLNRFARGVAQPGLSVKQLETIPFSIPPTEEQEQFERLYRQADKSKFDGFKSQFIEMFDSVESFSALENIVSDTFPGEWGNEPTSSNAIKVIRTTNFTNEGRLDLSEVVTREIDSKKVSRKKLKKGDTILERSGGTKDNPVGRVVFFDEDGDYLFNNFTQVLRPKENVNPVYLFYSLYNSYNLNKAAMRAMASQTTGIQNLSMSDYMAKQIKLPSKKLQDKFESIYRQSDKSKYYEINET